MEADSAELDRVPMAQPDPLAVWPVKGSASHHVAQDGLFSFGASRQRGKRRSIGVQIGFPNIAATVAPLPGKILAVVPWMRGIEEGPLFALFLRTHRYIFGLGGLVRGSWPKIPDTAVGRWSRGGDLLGRHHRSLHVSMFEREEGVTDGDFIASVRRGGLVWRVEGPVPRGLRDPTRFLETASTVEISNDDSSEGGGA